MAFHGSEKAPQNTAVTCIFKKKKILEESQQAGGKSGGGGRMRLKQKLDVCTLAVFQGVFRDGPLFES